MDGGNSNSRKKEDAIDAAAEEVVDSEEAKMPPNEGYAEKVRFVMCLGRVVFVSHVPLDEIDVMGWDLGANLVDIYFPDGSVERRTLFCNP